MPKDDPFEFDPFADMEQPPASPEASPPAPAAEDGGLSATDLFGEASAPEPQPRAAPKPKALQLDFKDVLGNEREVRGAKRVGAAALEMDQFLSKKDIAALERAKTVPKASLPSVIDLEERMGGTKVVAESKRFWVWLVLIALIPVSLIIGGAWMYMNQRAAKLEQEVEALRRAEELHRKATEKREQDLLR